MDFDLDKKNHMEKKDKSRKGEIDSHIIDLVNKINEDKDLFTTSSCAGRIRIISMDVDAKKNEVEWLYTSHETIETSNSGINQIMDSIASSDKDEQWFIMEGAIVHLCTRTIDKAHWIIKLAQEAGFKRSGIINAGKRIIIELLNNDRIETIIGKKGQTIIPETYVKELVEIANRKLVKNFSKIDKLYKTLL